MRATAIISFLFLLYTGYLSADITIRYDAIAGKQKKPVHSVSIKPNRVRIRQLTGHQPSVMVNLSSGDIVQLNPDKRQYFLINAQTLNQYVSLYRQNKDMLQVLIDQGIQHLDPQKRSQIEQMLKQFDDQAESSGTLIKNTDKSDKVLGVECRISSLYQQGQRVSDVCLADYQRLPLNRHDVQSLEQLKKLIQQFKQTAPKQQQDMLSIVVDGIEKLDGLPMKIVNYYTNGKIRNIIQAGAISFKKIPDQLYRIPQDYQKQLAPVL